MQKFLKNKRNKLRGGFTIVEILFSISIFLVVVGLITLFARNVWIFNSFVSGELDSVNTARNALKTMVAEIRTASSGSNGAYAVNLASTSSFTFYSDINDNGLKEKVRYFMNGTSLQKGVVVPTGSPLAYTGSEVITTLISNVTSATPFSYYDKNYDGTTAALSSPIDISAVRLVKITVTIDKDPNAPPAPVTISSQVSMRNIKDNL